MEIKYQRTKTLTTRENNRSSDFIAPNFLYGCGLNCSYCYLKRYNTDKLYINTNTEEILASIDNWIESKPWPKVPNQVDKVYYVGDIGCSCDVSLHLKHYDWQVVFDYFNNNPKAKFTFATKYPSNLAKKLDSYVIHPKNRIRVSLMPQNLSTLLEPNTDSIINRILTIPIFQSKMDTHVNFSPIVFTETWLEDYRALFEEIVANVPNYKELKFECIFLTYNELQAKRNSEAVNTVLLRPELQENKKSQYDQSGNNLRYQIEFKKQLITQFKTLFQEYFDLNNIRYIF